LAFVRAEPDGRQFGLGRVQDDRPGEARVHLRIGDTLDRYTVEALIGQGGMAAVYRVRHAQLHSEHALKVLFITSPKVITRLLREGRVQANLNHPNIVAVTDVLHVQGAPALVMEYVDGPALDTWLHEHRPNLDEALWLFRGILRAVAAAHERGVVHRDLKPANVLLAPSDEGLVPKVTDFGLVKSLYDPRGDTLAGMSLGTPEYMCPEQIRDASNIDARADMWALGCILYELVCHRRAFQGADKMGTFNLIVGGRYEPPRRLVDDLPRNVAEAIRCLLEVDRERRLSSCDELYDLLYEQSQHQAGRIAAPPKPVVPLRIEAPSIESVAPLELRPTPGQLSVPTSAPAAARAHTPRTRGSYDTQPSSLAPRASRRWTLGTLVTLLCLSLTTAGLLYYDQRKEPAVIDGPTLADAVKPHAPLATPVVVRFPSEAWEDDDWEPEIDRSQPPISLRRGRSPARSVPAASVPDTGEVRIVGDATAVWLVSDGERVEPQGAVPPGPYRLVASFGEAAPAEVGEVIVPEGSVVTVDCSSASNSCSPL
jgi:eukaryotic-like serine/threonine-protein kinase